MRGSGALGGLQGCQDRVACPVDAEADFDGQRTDDLDAEQLLGEGVKRLAVNQAFLVDVGQVRAAAGDLRPGDGDRLNVAFYSGLERVQAGSLVVRVYGDVAVRLDDHQGAAGVLCGPQRRACRFEVKDLDLEGWLAEELCTLEGLHALCNSQVLFLGEGQVGCAELPDSDENVT